MSLHHDLLEQARQLATRERTRPKQSSLRRSVSASYYALFHLLLDTATRRLVSGNDRQALRYVLRRAFSHASMKNTAAGFTSGAGGVVETLRPGLNNLQLQPELMRVAAMFRDLQELRHEADYDLSRPFTRLEALDLYHGVKRAFDDWRTVAGTPRPTPSLSASSPLTSCAPDLRYARPPKPRPIDTHKGPGFPQTAYIAKHHPRGATEWNCGTGR